MGHAIADLVIGRATALSVSAATSISRQTKRLAGSPSANRSRFCHSIPLAFLA